MATIHPALWDIPSLRPLAPLVLAAWDDEWLSPAELLAIRAALERSANVEALARDVLHAWLNPDQPPPAAALRELEREISRVEPGQWFALPASSDALSSEQLELLRSLDVRLPRTLPATATTQPQPVDSSRWRAALDGDTRELRDATRTLLRDPLFRTLRDPELRAYREQVFAWCRALSRLPLFAHVTAKGEASDIAAFVACFETIAYFDLSLVVKFGVQFGLFADSIRNLGTAEHHALLPRIVRTEIVGCFAMTERAHGSNVRSLQTVASYDPATPIFNYLSHRQRLLPGLAAAYAFSFAQHALLRKLAATKNEPEQGRDIGTLAAGLKALGTWQAIETLQHCRESCGGQGYLSANRIDALRTDADVFATFEGDNTVLLQLVAKDLLRARLRGFQEHPVRSLARAIVDNLGNAIAERNPLATRRTDPDSLTSLEFHARALRHRERSLTASLSARIQRRMSEGANAQDAFEACQDHALALAKAHTERFVYDSFANAAEGDATLEPLCALYGLGRLAKDMAWFVEDGYVAAEKARAIRKQINTLLGELAPHSLPLTDAFGIPETCLGPLADPEYLRASGLAPE